MLETLGKEDSNLRGIAEGLVEILTNEAPLAQEHVTRLLRNLAMDPENRTAIAKAGAVPQLVRQLEMGCEKAMGLAAHGLALISLKSAEHRATVKRELVSQSVSQSVQPVRQGEGSQSVSQSVSQSSR